ncbi:MAG: hypothetical protein H6563_08500 [Lewinellaceae bacterium]|nr:hypothetical protein [Lewinellaceae bacterium]
MPKNTGHLEGFKANGSEGVTKSPPHFRIWHAVFHRWGFFFRHWRERGIAFFREAQKSKPGYGWWWLEMTVRLTELAGLFVLYETLAEVVKWNTRPLTGEERALVEPIFGKNIRLDLVRVDRWALIGSAQRRFAYVSGHTVNGWRQIAVDVLVHELVHVWQYEQMGAVYIPRAWRAQFSLEGYNYGGVERIREYLGNNRTFLEFNLEQQAELVMDYFRIRSGRRPQWGNGGPESLDWYEQLLRPYFTLTETPELPVVITGKKS